MKRLVLLAILLVSAQMLTAQTRARRVGQASTPPASPNISNRAPVLAGSTSNGGNRNQGSPTAHAGPEEVDSNDIIRVNTTLVTIPVSVMERDGRYVPNLRKEDFRLWEDGVEQQIAFFATVDKPFSLVLLLDTSSSTRFKLNEIQDAAITFVNQLQPDDRVMVITFDDKIRVLSDFTSDRRRLRDAILQTRTGDGTKLYDAVDMVINQKLSREQGKKAVVLFTDGVDTTSKHASFESTIRDAEELDAMIYPVQYDTYSGGGGGGGSWPGSQPRSSGSVWIDILGGVLGGGRNRGNHGGGSGGGGGAGSSRGEYDRGDRYLHELANRTAGRLYQADSTYNLATAFANVAEELRRQYSIGYYPKAPSQAGQRRSIKVRTNQPNLAVRSRDSYIFSPQQSTQADTTSAPVLQKKLANSRTAGTF
ncbi:MAG TPA: VWA domain-containing protein [Pyrinomonadaceae bacterium]|nr:VWA domain-containing protein [Pyrinomonadaceae bacterium]